MSPSTASAAMRFLVNGSGDSGTVTVVLFGGEPLLNFAACRAAVEQGRSLARAAGKRLGVTLMTNGTLLGPEVVSWLNDHGVVTVVSVDGDREVHDQRRQDARGQPSFDAVAGNVRRALALPRRSFPLIAQCVVDGGRPPVAEAIENLLQLGFDEVYTMPLLNCPAATEGPVPVRDDEALARGYREAARRVVRHALAGRYWGWFNLRRTLAALRSGSPGGGGRCPAGTWRLTVDTNGDLYPCFAYAAGGYDRVGDLGEGVRESAEISDDAACTGCEAAAACGGRCHHPALGRGNDRCRMVILMARLAREVERSLERSAPGDIERIILAGRFRRALERVLWPGDGEGGGAQQ